MNHYTVKGLPADERPYEKCLQKGAAALSDAELLAVVLRCGTQGVTSVEMARDILNLAKNEGGLSGLASMSIPELRRIRGVGKVKAVQLQCITELSRRMAKERVRETAVLNEASSIAGYYMEDFRHLQQEHVMVLMFDSKCRLLHEEIVSKGTVDRALVTPREIFLRAFAHRAVFVILLHNHPSGDPSPSEEDNRLTIRVHEAGELLGIPLMDHIIMGDQRYFSYREEGMI